jgi:single-stranded DNA-binding protein
MAKVNELKFEGRVLGDVKTFGSGKVLQEWAMGISTGKTKDGAWGKNHMIQVKHWGNSAPVRGADIIITGRLGAEAWTKNGVDASKVTIICESFSVVGDDLSDHQNAHQQAKQNGYAPEKHNENDPDSLPF